MYSNSQTPSMDVWDGGEDEEPPFLLAYVCETVYRRVALNILISFYLSHGVDDSGHA